MSDGYGMEDLLGEFGERWKVCYEKYEDGYHLEAVARPPDPFGPKVTEKTVPLLRDALRAEEEIARLLRNRLRDQLNKHEGTA